MLVRSLLLLLCRQKKLPGFVATLLIADFDAILANALDWFRAKSRNLSVKLLFWGIGLLVLTQAFVWTGFFRESNLKLAEYFIPWTAREPGKRPAAIVLGVSTVGDPWQDNFAGTSSIVEQLKAAGAKAVAVDYRLAGWDIRRTFVRSDVAVLGLPLAFHMFVGDSIHEAYYTLDFNGMRRGNIHTLMPRRMPEEPDMTLELIRKVRGFSDGVPIRKIGNTIVFGDYKIPLNSDGSIYVDLSGENYARNELLAPAYVSQNRKTGALEYRSLNSSTVDTTKNLLAGRYAHLFKDKAVILMSLTGSVFDRSSQLDYGQAYAMAFMSMLEKHYLVQSGWLHLVFSAVLLFLCGLVCRLLRPGFAFPLLIVVAVGSFVFGHWLFHVQRLFIELTAFVVAISLAMFIFPAVRFAHDARKDTETPINTVHAD